MTAPGGVRGRPVLLGVCHDASSSFLRGAADAPAAIRRELQSTASNAWSERLQLIAPGVAWDDAGDVALGDDDPRAAIEQAVDALLAAGRRPVVLGGDHSITYPVLRAVRRHHPRLTILHLDAHNDLYESFEGDRFSHASPFARIMEEALADQLVQVGIRAMTQHQREQGDRFGVDVVDMRRWVAGDRFALRHPVYLSLDIDVLDPAFAPGVSHREPGGLSVREVLSVVQGIDQPMVGADLVEYNPRRDLDEVTAPVCAKLIKEIVAQMQLRG
ncbi:MAG: agmatinase [Gemmatimonadaceae bacterium]|nr:agmatinase [Gemmatimonadaceae bacterium]